VINTDVKGTFTFVFKPDNDDLCAVETSIQVSVIGNTPPVAVNDAAVTIQGVAIEIDILKNDTDDSGIDKTSVTIVKEPAHGTVTVNPVTGALIYTPEGKFTGTDVIRYSVCDDGKPCGVLCSVANVTITVRPPNRPPVARDDNYTVMCFPLIGYPLVNDYDPDRDKIRIVPWPMVDVQHGTLTIQADGAFIYMPDEGYVGLDTFVYRIYDDGLPELWDEATVRINVLPGVDCDGLPGDPDQPKECSLLIPDGFSPNGDGVHEFFQIYCMEKYPEAILRIFDRAGNKLFQKHNYGNLNYWSTDENAWWWGNSEHRMTLGRGTLPAGTYLYVLELGNGEVRTGTVMIAY
jgi:gliding motility-associated-like protein